MHQTPVRFYLAVGNIRRDKENFELRKAYEISQVIKNKL